MAVLTPRSVFRRYEVDGIPSSGHHKVIKDEVVQLLGQIFGVSRGGWVVTQTLAELNGVTPESETDGGVVLDDPDPANNGHYSRDGGGWVKGRGFPDTFARVALSGSGSAQTGVVETGVNPADVEVFFAFVETDNTGPLTLAIGGEAPREVVNLAGNALSAGEWAGVVMFALRDGKYQLLLDAGAAQAAAQSASDAKDEADRAEGEADRAESEADRSATNAMSVVARAWFKSVSDLLSDDNDIVGYVGSGAQFEVVAGDIIEAQGFRYEVAASDATDGHEETAGGVKLYEAGPIFTQIDRMARVAGTSEAPFAILADPLRYGEFFWDGGDHSALVTADTEQGLAIAPEAEPTGEFGACIRKFYGTPSLEWFGVVDNGFDQSSKMHAAFAAIGSGDVLAPEGELLCNIIIPDNIVLRGAGRFKTLFKAADTGTAIIEIGDATALDSWYLGLSDCRIDGEGTAAEGLRVGRSSASRTVTYGEISRVEVRNCVTNIRMQNTVGFSLDHVYSFGAEQDGLHIGNNDIVTVLQASFCQFRQNRTGIRMTGGAIASFYDVIVESNRNIGLFLSRATGSGARQVMFKSTWFENNGHTPEGSESSIPCSMFLDMSTLAVSNDYPSYLSFEGGVLDAAGGVPVVRLNRASEVEFKDVAFRGLTSSDLVFNSGTGYAYGTLLNCGTLNARPSPALYASFPALVDSGGNLYGYKYRYLHGGREYTNIQAGS